MKSKRGGMKHEGEKKSLDTADHGDYFIAVHVLYSRICGTGIHRAGCFLYREEVMARSDRDDQEEKKIKLK